MNEGSKLSDSTEVAVVNIMNATAGSSPSADSGRITALVERNNNRTGPTDDSSVILSHHSDRNICRYTPYWTRRFLHATGRLTAHADIPFVRFSGASAEAKFFDYGSNDDPLAGRTVRDPAVVNTELVDGRHFVLDRFEEASENHGIPAGNVR